MSTKQDIIDQTASYAALIRKVFVPKMERKPYPDVYRTHFTDWSDIPNKLLNRKIAGMLFQISPQTIARWEEKDGLQSYQLGQEKVYVGFQLFQCAMNRHIENKATNQPRGIPLLIQLELAWGDYWKMLAKSQAVPKQPEPMDVLIECGLFDFFMLAVWQDLEELKNLGCPFLLSEADAESPPLYRPKR